MIHNIHSCNRISHGKPLDSESPLLLEPPTLPLRVGDDDTMAASEAGAFVSASDAHSVSSVVLGSLKSRWSLLAVALHVWLCP